MIMKRKTIIGSGIVLIGMLVSGLAASVAWFLAGDNTFKTDVNGSVVEEYFHCGSGTEADPFVITRPMHYYHLVEFFQRKTELLVSDDENDVEYNVTFGTDYLYFQIGYDFDENSAHGPNLEVYDYDNDGTYAGTKSKVLNMAYFSGDNALMPIGTSECPFFGSFNGGANEDDAKAIKVQNLNIKSQEDVIVEGGSSLTTRYTSDVGMFGYVADNDGSGHDTSIHDLYIDGLSIDLTGAVAGKNAVDAEGVSHESTHDSEIYVGYIVGHLHTYTNYSSTGPTNASPIHDVYVNDAKILGGAAQAKCAFGYVGYADSIDGKEGTSYSLAEQIQQLEKSSGGSGQGDNWGGSINIKELNLRFYNMLNVTNDNAIATDDPATHHPTANGNTTVNTITTGKTFLSRIGYNYSNSGTSNQHRYYSDDFNKLSIATYGSGYSANAKMNNSPLNQITLYCLEDSRTKTATYSTTTSSSGKTNYSTALPGSILPLNVDTKANGYETYHSEELGYNTGYIVGGQTKTNFGYSSSTSDRYYSSTTVRTASSSISNIQYSINSTSSFNNSSLEVLTNISKSYDSATPKNNFARIEDSYNKNNSNVSSQMAAITSGRAKQREVLSTSLNSYEFARESLGNGSDGILDNASYIHGLHFLNGLVSTSSKEVADNIYINSTTPLNNYELPRSCIDFNLKKKGFISFFAGSYQNATIDCDGFFSLYTISRTTTNSGSTINSIREIDKVYKNPDSATKEEYPYLYKIRDANTYTTGSTDISLTQQQISALELMFDCEYIRHDPPLDGAIYYFEIPSNKGEYVIGNADNAGNSTGATAGAYLMYLDIAASNETEEHSYDQENKIAEQPIFTQIEYTSSGYVITNSCFNIGFVVPTGGTKDTFSVAVNRVGDVFNVVIINTSGNDVTLHILLVDNDAINNNAYPYTYTIKYNTGAVSEAYGYSASWDGTSGGATMTRHVYPAS